MAKTYFNGNLIRNANFNGHDLNKIYFNNNLVFSKTLVISVRSGYSNDSNSAGKFINVSKLIATYRKFGENEIIIKTIKDGTYPRFIFNQVVDGTNITKITLENHGFIQATAESGYGIAVNNNCKLYLDNLYKIAGGGGRGGKGHIGATGAAGSTYSKTFPHSKRTVEKHGYTNYKSWGYSEGLANCSSNQCDYAAWSGHYKMFCSGKSTGISGVSGTFTRGRKTSRDDGGGCPWNHYEIVRTYTKRWTTKTTYRGGGGGRGGDGGAGGIGYHYGKNSTDMEKARKGHAGGTGHGGSPSNPRGGHSGSTGGKGYAGGDGGGWGHAGYTGQGHGSAGGAAGVSIKGINNCVIIHKGTLYGATVNA